MWREGDLVYDAEDIHPVRIRIMLRAQRSSEMLSSGPGTNQHTTHN